MSSNSINFMQLNVTEYCSNPTQIVPANPSDISHCTYDALKRDADVEYLS